VLKVSGLRTYYETFGGNVKAVDDVSFGLSEGEALGLIGESACGKTTTALSVIRLLPPNGKIIAGKVFLDGEEILSKSDSEMRKIRWKKVSIVFQSAMNALHPVFKIKDQIAEAILTHEKLTKHEVMDRVGKLIEMVRIDPSKLEDYPHELSGGMKQRVVIAMALANYPKIVIADEPTTALDVIVQAQVLKLIKDLQAELNLSMLLITHDLSVVAEICHTLGVMYAGNLVEYSSLRETFEFPKHPYTQGMLESFPTLSRSRKEPIKFIPGAPPNLIKPPSGCRFHPRCPHAKKVCSKKKPETVEVKKDHFVACYLYT
jgi:peptide/nickel transport system ATP-binding protein